jgi:hypothetical protein
MPLRLAQIAAKNIPCNSLKVQDDSANKNFDLEFVRQLRFGRPAQMQAHHPKLHSNTRDEAEFRNADQSRTEIQYVGPDVHPDSKQIARR